MERANWSEQAKAAHALHYAKEEERALFEEVQVAGRQAQTEGLEQAYIAYGNASVAADKALKDFEKAKPPKRKDYASEPKLHNQTKGPNANF